MNLTPDTLARLQANRLATIRASAARCAPYDRVLRQQRCAVAREFGRRAAIEYLDWAQVVAFCNVLADALRSSDEWAPGWGRSSIDQIAGQALAKAAPVDCPYTYFAFLEGVQSVALAVESQC